MDHGARIELCLRLKEAYAVLFCFDDAFSVYEQGNGEAWTVIPESIFDISYLEAESVGDE